MKKLKILVVVMMCALGLSVGVQTAIGAEAIVTQATVQSFFVDEDGIFYPATCDETQVINGNQRKEMFHCTFDAAVPATLVCDTSVGCDWFSDFDGAEATSTHFAITPSGLMVGWALY